MFLNLLFKCDAYFRSVVKKYIFTFVLYGYAVSEICVLTNSFFLRPQKVNSIQEPAVNHVDTHASPVSKQAPVNQVKAVSLLLM